MNLIDVLTLSLDCHVSGVIREGLIEQGHVAVSALLKDDPVGV